MRRNTAAIVTAGAILVGLHVSSISGHANALKVGDVSLGAITLPTRAAFLGRMAELGYEQGRNFSYEYIQVRDRDGFAEAYRDLIDRRVDILIAAGHEHGLKAALGASRTLPIAMVAIDYDPMAGGYVKSLARPGRNVTGIVFQQISLTKKRLQLMKDAFPEATAATVIWDWASGDQWRVARTVSKEIGYPVHGLRMQKKPYDYETAFAQVPAQYRQALLVPASPEWKFPERGIIPDFVRRHGIRAMYFSSSYVRSGGLISYGVSFPKLFRRLADYVDKLAKGADPKNLPVEQPTRFELVVNLKTAESMGVILPPSIMVLADEVIE